jgi:hypothetical protein
MQMTEWIREFSALHAQAKAGTISADDRAVYLRAREELAEAMLLAQRLNMGAGQVARRSLRVAQALPVELELATGKVGAVTLDVSAGGFSTLVSEAPEKGERIVFKLKLGRSLEPISGGAKVVNVVPHKGSLRVGFMFEEMAASDKDRLELVIVDKILDQFGMSKG